ncbi:MAG: hypothetical protein HRT61_19245, partial [Ekhidna sp.]|nr:hypothetical protein [Ekhidna sp.]
GVNKYLYSDGALIGTQAKTGNIAAMSTVNSIGSSRGTSEYFNGQIDEVRFWSTARYEDQILAFKDVELNGGEPGLEAYYNFSDGPGDNLVPDLASSGGVQNGILTNMDNATDYVVATHGVSDASALDVTAPSVTVSSTESGTTSLAPFPVTFTFTEFVVGFEVSDINAPAAIVSNLSTADNIVWTADITPPVEGAINVDVANGSVQDLTGNALSGSTAFDITFDAPENALTFDGLNDFVDISDVDKITNPALQDYTISMWFSSEDPSGGDFLLSYSHSLSGNEPFSSLTVNNTINFSRRNTAGGESLTLTGPEITANEWYL